MNVRAAAWSFTLCGGLFLAACGGAPADGDAARGAAAEPAGLTAEQLEKGVGPVTEIELAALDETLAAKGLEIFTLKCSACHKPDERYVGPPLRDVTERRAPEFVMNMMLNPAEMLQKHPEVKRLLAEYMNPMPSQNLTQDDARAVLEYLRSLAAAPSGTTEN